MLTGRLRAYVPLGVTAVLALALAGCGGASNDSSPTLTPIAGSTTTTPAPSPTTAPPRQVVRAGPPPKTPFTKQGAELFVRDYYATVNASLRAGSATTLRQYIQPGCDCDNLLQVVTSAANRRQHFVGSGFQLSSVRATYLVGAAAVVKATFSLARMRVVDHRGRTVDYSNAVRRQTNSLVVLHQNGSWRLEKVILGRRS